jgi:hypothetical protein
MPTAQETIAEIVEAPTWDQRIAKIRLIPQRHGTAEHPEIYAAVARLAYVPDLAPDYAYIHGADFYGQRYFEEVYAAAAKSTAGFTKVSESDLAAAIADNPRILLVLRTIVGFTKEEFSQSTRLAGKTVDLPPLTPSKVDSMERKGTAATPEQARIAAATLCRIMDSSLFGKPPGNLLSKQAKPDTKAGWASVRHFASGGVPFPLFLHQRHYGGAFRQILDATSTLRGNLIEDAVESLFTDNGIPFLRTGTGGNQAVIAERFEVQVTPAPDFVIYDNSGSLRAMLECKTINDGGTARDKAPRFALLRRESIRLGGVPLIAVLGGTGWARVNDTLGPVVRDTDGRVFTLATISRMLSVFPFPSLIGLTRQ